MLNYGYYLGLENWQKLPKLLKYTVRALVFGRHQFFGTSEHYGKPMKFIIWMNEV